MTLRRRPLSDSFSIGKQREKLEAEPENTSALEMIEFYKTFAEEKLKQEGDPQWQKDNMEYDLRTTDWIAEKCEDDVYAQNLYAAMCNNDFIKNDVWPLLQDKRWSCSWRYAGGILADIRQRGDYMDFYCSGIRNSEYDEEINAKLNGRNYVAECVVTDEIKQDLFRLGWLVITEDNEE